MPPNEEEIAGALRRDLGKRPCPSCREMALRGFSQQNCDRRLMKRVTQLF